MDTDTSIYIVTRWTCDRCGGPLAGGVFYPRGGARWCEHCTADDAAAQVDHRDFMRMALEGQRIAEALR